MIPGDAFARETVAYLDAARPRSKIHLWDEPDLLLFIDNRRTLHARDEVQDPDTRSIARIVFQWGEMLL
jgi:alpha-ketoglutarate-dependent taurine dioxygenase